FGASFPCPNEERFAISASLTFKYQGRQGFLVEATTAKSPKIFRKLFLRGIPAELPRYLFEKLRRTLSERHQHEPHHHRSPLYVAGTRAVNPVPFDLPTEMISLLFLGRKDRVEM